MHRLTRAKAWSNQHPQASNIASSLQRCCKCHHKHEPCPCPARSPEDITWGVWAVFGKHLQVWAGHLLHTLELTWASQKTQSVREKCIKASHLMFRQAEAAATSR